MKLDYKKIITLFGCGGNRDKTKRASMAQIAEKYSANVIVTSDNPRNEELNQIISDIEYGFENNKHIVIKNRTKALLYGLSLLNPKSVLLILGKGIEKYQDIDGYKIPHDDQKIILKALNESWNKIKNKV